MKFMVQHRDELSACWGPFDSRETAEAFAEFARQEIDPVIVRPLRSPIGEILAYYRVRDRLRDLEPSTKKPEEFSLEWQRQVEREGRGKP